MQHEDVLRLYNVMHAFSSEFHSIIEAISGRAMHGQTLRESICLGLAELWECNLFTRFPTRIAALVEERDKAVVAANHFESELLHLQLATSDLQAGYGTSPRIQ